MRAELGKDSVQLRFTFQPHGRLYGNIIPIPTWPEAETFGIHVRDVRTGQFRYDFNQIFAITPDDP